MNINSVINFFKNNKSIILYTCVIVLVLALLAFVITKSNSGNFFKSTELKSFDLRQSVIADSKKVSDDIVILTVDDESYEYFIDKYGDWPIPRRVYANILNYVEEQNPYVVGFDLLFVHSLKSNVGSDARLASTMAKYDNAFTAISFDDMDFEVREPIGLPEKLAAKLEIKSKNFAPQIIPNCRSLFPQLMNATDNIGHINTAKDDDGITRSIPLYIAYPKYHINEKGDFAYNKEDINYYPYMTFKMAQHYLAEKNRISYEDLETPAVVQNGKLKIGSDYSFPIANDARVMLNWYGETGMEKNAKTFKYIPLWKVDKAMNGDFELPEDTFKNKVVFIGTSVFSLSDIKSVPTSKYMPGVEIHATLFNNFIDNSFIRQASATQNIVISLMLAAIVALIAFYSTSVVMSIALSTVVVMAYCVLSTLIMQFFNLWIWLVLPIVLSIVAIICVYVVKYILKSRDFELTYKLATTDGLTDLYNHRFFQEQMAMCIADCKRYGRKFSLIMIDIDFFKKFNDTYGHQAGDAVLRGVAHTLKRNVRSSDVVCRYGGEEMAIILKDTDFDQAFLTAEKVCKTIAEKPFKIAANTEKQVTISLGVSTFPDHGQTVQEMIEHADQGLYAAKENGRNQVGRIE